MSTKMQLNQGTIQKVSQEYYIPLAVNAFLLDRKAQNLAAGTLYFYQAKLSLFLSFCDTQVIKTLDELTPDSIRQWLFHLEQTKHNPGGIHACFRTLRTFLYWWEREFEPEGWKNPIRKVKAPRLALEPLQPISRDDFESLLATCGKSWHGARDRAILVVDPKNWTAPLGVG